jgi:hypothetical protein
VRESICFFSYSRLRSASRLVLSLSWLLPGKTRAGEFGRIASAAASAQVKSAYDFPV